jgi:diguanylate cyclase (GGDEF)-like protein
MLLALLPCSVGLALELPAGDRFQLPLNGEWLVYVDHTGSANLQSIRKQRYQFVPQSQFRAPLAPMQTFWLRLSLENPSASKRNLWLELDTAQARNAQLHVINGPYIKTLGLSPSNDDSSTERLATMDFPISVAAGDSVELYLRLTRPWQTGFDATLVDSWSHQRSSHQRLFVSGASLGGLLVLFLSVMLAAPKSGSQRMFLALVILTGILYAATLQGWQMLLAPANDSRSGLLQLAPLFCQASFIIALLLYSRVIWPPQSSRRVFNISRWGAIVVTCLLLFLAPVDFGLGFYGLAIMECLVLLLFLGYLLARLAGGDIRMLIFIVGVLLYSAITGPLLVERLAPVTGYYPGKHWQLSIAGSSLPGAAMLCLALLFSLGQRRLKKTAGQELADPATLEDDNFSLEPISAPVTPDWWQLLEANLDGVLVCERGRVLYCNKAAAAMLDSDQSEITGKPLSLVLGSGSDSESLLREAANKPILLQRSSSNDQPALTVSSRQKWVEHRSLTLVSLREISPGTKQIEQTDTLTGLPTLEVLSDRFNQLHQTAPEQPTVNAVLLSKLDQLTALQQRYGRQRCERLIKALAIRVNRAMSSETIMSRWGEAQFVVLLHDIGNAENAAKVAAGVLKQLQQPVTIDEREMHTHASIGIALYPDDASSLEDLLKLAQHAAETAQHLGGGRYQFCNAASAEKAGAGAAQGPLAAGAGRLFVTSFHEAQRKHNCSLVIEPIMGLPAKDLAGLRLLPCWPDLPNEYRSSEQLYLIATQTDVADKMSAQLLRDACRFGATNREAAGGPICVKLALSYVQAPRFIDSVSSLIASSSARADQFLLAFDEPALLSHADANIARLSQLRQLGFALCIDNFSDSDPAFSLLRSGIFSEIGVSTPWIKSRGTQMRDLQKLETLIKLCHSLDLRVRVDQANTEQHLKIAKLLNCDCASGSIVDSLLTFE